MQVLNASTSYELESLQIYLGASLVMRSYPICYVFVGRAKISFAKIVVNVNPDSTEYFASMYFCNVTPVLL